MPGKTKSQKILDVLTIALDLPAGRYTLRELQVSRVDEDGSKIALFHNYEYVAHMIERIGHYNWSIGKIGGELTKAERRHFQGPAIVSTPYGASYTIGE